MVTLKAALTKLLHNAQKIALLGVGSKLRGDDAAGILVAEYLAKAAFTRKGKVSFKVFIGDTAPENLTGEIKKFKPSHLIVVDAAAVSKKSGQIKLIKPEQAGGVTFCTHQLPLKIMIDYLRQAIGCKVIIIGISPGRLDFLSECSSVVRKQAKYLARLIKESVTTII